jgi:hypothetical protein
MSVGQKQMWPSGLPISGMIAGWSVLFLTMLWVAGRYLLCAGKAWIVRASQRPKGEWAFTFWPLARACGRPKLSMTGPVQALRRLWPAILIGTAIWQGQGCCIFPALHRRSGPHRPRRRSLRPVRRSDWVSPFHLMAITVQCCGKHGIAIRVRFCPSLSGCQIFYSATIAICRLFWGRHFRAKVPTVSADHHRIAARVDLRSGGHQTEEVDVTGIVDRIGAGDAFAAGVLHAHLNGGDAAAMAQTGLALTVLKHSLPGDASLFQQADIDAFIAGGLDVRR